MIVTLAEAAATCPGTDWTKVVSLGLIMAAGVVVTWLVTR